MMKAVYGIRSYLAYLAKAKTRYGVHSPFVYRLLDQVIRETGRDPAYEQIALYRRSLLKNKTYLHVTDLGAGSRHFRFAKRRIDRMARHSANSYKENRLWYRLAKHFQPKRILELGTHLGTATYALHLGAPHAQLTSVEGSTELAQWTEAHLKRFGVKHVRIIQADFDRILPELVQETPYDLIVVDGNHRYEPTLRYFDYLLKAVHPGSLIIWDDIHWSEEMSRAWEVIQSRPEVSVSIDLFCCGLTFFREGQQKEHFVLRF